MYVRFGSVRFAVIFNIAAIDRRIGELELEWERDRVYGMRSSIDMWENDAAKHSS